MQFGDKKKDNFSVLETIFEHSTKFAHKIDNQRFFFLVSYSVYVLSDQNFIGYKYNCL